MTVSTSRSSARGGSLDLFRFLAALFIVLYHAAFEAPGGALSSGPITRGYLATDFFLMLSGYVLGRAYGGKLQSGSLTAKDFWIRRVLRIWPSHLVVLAGFAVLVAAAAVLHIQPNRPHWFDWINLPAEGLLLQAWGFTDGGGWNEPTWSLSALMACYLAFPYAWKVMSRLRSPYVAIAASGILLVAMNLFTQASLHQDIYDLRERFGVIRAFPLFLVGVSITRLVADKPLAQSVCPYVVVASVVSLIGLQYLGRFDLISVALVALAVAAAGSGAVRRPSRLATFGARISFSLFLTHTFAFTLWFGASHALAHRGVPFASGWTVWLGGIAFSIALAAAFDRLVDQPVQTRIKARLAGQLSRTLADPVDPARRVTAR